MSTLMRASEVEKRPVVTMDGVDVAQIKDIVYQPGGGQVAGFTLNGRGLFSGPRKDVLGWAAVSALGPDAVMIDSEDVLASPAEAFAGDGSSSRGGHDDVLGSEVLTDTGTNLGKVVDVIIEVSGQNDGQCDVVGYEIQSSEALANNGTKVLIPLPDTLAASGQHLMVPARATEFVRNDLAGFGAAVDEFRSALKGE
ncbi:PRC-barrel domain-containing protein [Rhodococcus sp. NBC_00297]|uniref:PRC-barrel domain-containing protein n=1 Tax=Rhodococcus sp. NBC_00297 TaxID=2976005 RepID=UPI002E27C806|nr:PRC-barrel domain-containing protein [Rhodococcus sp. NBC_00297]